MIFGQDNGFWTATIGAALIRVLTADYVGPLWARTIRAVVTGFSAVFAAYIFTDPLLDFTSYPPETYKIPFAALLALTGEGVMRMLMNLDWQKAMEALRAWRGK